MNQLTNFTTLSTLSQSIQIKKCNKCNNGIAFFNSFQLCSFCYKINIISNLKQSGNKIIDDFIRSTQINHFKNDGKMEFVPYEQFKNIKLIAEGGFSKIYKATWINGPVLDWDIWRNKNLSRQNNYTVVLKKLNNSKNITLKELNELKQFHDFSSNLGFDIYRSVHVGKYFGITQDRDSQDIIIIMPYYNLGDLVHYISKNFYNFSWYDKLIILRNVIIGLFNIHEVNIIHRDLHSGNIFFDKHGYYGIDVVIGDLGISKSATESDDNDENYGIIPYMAPEIFQGQKYTKASDIYSFGMIMWEFMTARRPFWNRNHDTDLIIKICDGLRPPIVTNAPKGYIELMKECWHSNPKKRPTAIDIYKKIDKLFLKEWKDNWNKNPTKVIESSDIGPVTKNNPGAIYKSRPLSGMIQSTISARSSRIQSINLESDPFYFYQRNNVALTGKRKFEDNLVEDNNGNNQIVKRKKSSENDYFTKEIEFDINGHHYDVYTEYTTKEFDFDINIL